MAANDGKQRSGAGTQPGGETRPRTGVPNYPVKPKDGHGMPTPPSFPSGDTSRKSGSFSGVPDGD